MEFVLLFSAIFLAYTNGANDNFKGVATLLGSRTLSYRQALVWATGTTLAGSLTAVFLSGELVRTFSGKGLVPDAVLAGPFLAAVGLGAATTVLLATLVGIPISTTHGLTGALVGAGLMAVWTDVRVELLESAFLLPLLVSPVLAIGVTSALYPMFRFLRARLNIEKETCICLDTDQEPVPLQALTLQNPALPVQIGTLGTCVDRYEGKMFGLAAQQVLDGLHFFSAGAVGFARGLNDTPKIVGLLAGAQLMDVEWGALMVGLVMALGGLLNARRVAETMSYGITEMNSGQGFTANLVTAMMVLGASRVGVPVSTTHVSCGSLFGLGLVTGEARWRTIGGIVLAWGITLPVAALLAGIAFFVLGG
ncbi:MAG: inorganic phosphate transporter [bacterium]|nr:inorganic phosphate transporter [bacterium]